MLHIRDSGWRLVGAILAFLGFIFLVGGIIAYAGDYQEYVAVLIVFGGIFLDVGIGLVAITFFEKKTNRHWQEEKRKSAPTLPASQFRCIG
jgi:uncharacterized membrane protein